MFTTSFVPTNLYKFVVCLIITRLATSIEIDIVFFFWWQCGGGGGGDGDGGGDVPEDVLKLLAEHGLRTVTQLFNSMYETAKWPTDFAGNKDCLKEEAKSYEMQRPSYNRHHSAYSKDGDDNSKGKDGKENWGCTWGI